MDYEECEGISLASIFLRLHESLSNQSAHLKPRFEVPKVPLGCPNGSVLCLMKIRQCKRCMSTHRDLPRIILRRVQNAKQVGYDDGASSARVGCLAAFICELGERSMNELGMWINDLQWLGECVFPGTREW